jgi:UDP-GlcNAc:undecaprenyl-phosphate GlcNAc-1-phosphate transferase
MNWLLIDLYFLGATCALAAALTPWCKSLSFKFGFLDEPDRARKIHAEAKGLLGGVAVFVAFAGVLVAHYFAARMAGQEFRSPFFTPEVWARFWAGLSSAADKLVAVMVGATAMLVLGMVDDKIEMRAGSKFLCQIAIAVFVAIAGVRLSLFIPSPLLGAAATVLWILIITNAMNFLDNMDGLCAGIGAICSLLFAFISGVQGQWFVTVFAASFAGALIGFLFFNFHPAKIFLGDAGSHLVGFMLSVIPILTTFYARPDGKGQIASQTFLPVLIPLIVLSVPMFDLAAVCWIRIRRGLPVYQGDVNHISHRFVRLGLPRPWAVLCIYLITFALGLGAVVLLWANIWVSIVVLLQSAAILALVSLLQYFGKKKE